MNQDGPLAGGGDFKQADEAFTLDIMRRALVIVIETDFATGDDLWLGEQAVKVGEDSVVDFRGVVRIDARARVEPRDSRLAVDRLSAET